jgi:hypothetical protein
MLPSVDVITLDLKPFGLKANDLDATPISEIDRDTYSIVKDDDGYKIPYWDINGKKLSHIRIRSLSQGFVRTDKFETKIYFPKMFRKIAQKNIDGKTLLFIVDDERLATKLTQINNFRAVAIQGPRGWKVANLADGFKALVTMIIEEELTVILWIGDGTDKIIQTHIADLGMELKLHGIPFPNIRQFNSKLLNENLLEDVVKQTSAFPKHPNIRHYIDTKIKTSQRLDRTESQEIGMAMLSDIESIGARIRSSTSGDMYFFDKEKRILIPAIVRTGKELMNSSAFMSYIYNRYGIASYDHSIMSWFTTQFSSEQPIHDTRSHKNLFTPMRKDSIVAIQISDTSYVMIKEKNGNFCSTIEWNGDNGIMFESGKTKPVDLEKLKSELTKARQTKILPNFWRQTLNEVRVRQDGSTKDVENFKDMLSVLYYLTPWLKGWNNLQLPIELYVGEAGTGKSSVAALRDLIITGNSKLETMKTDIREWSTSVIGAGGILTFDNVDVPNRSIRKVLSDEISRLITSPEPVITLRQLYKTAEVAEFPVQCTFVITSIKNVFTETDFLQRSIVVNFQRPITNTNVIKFVDWPKKMLMDFGGRECWLANQIVAIERFFQLASKIWDDQKESRHRLTNLEQVMYIMSQVFGLNEKVITNTLIERDSANIVSLNPTITGLYEFANQIRQSKKENFTVADIQEWAMENDEHCDNTTLTNRKKLAQFLKMNRTTISQHIGFVPVVPNNNQNVVLVKDVSLNTKYVLR